MASDDVHPTPEANWLRKNWNSESLGQYEGLWIAVKGDKVVYSSSNLETMLAETIDRDPLYAFVYFGPMQ